MEQTRFYRPVKYANTCRVKPEHADRENAAPETAIRAYRCSPDAWTLQIRDYLRLYNGARGKDFVVASATLHAADLLALRDALTALLEEK